MKKVFKITILIFVSLLFTKINAQVPNTSFPSLEIKSSEDQKFVVLQSMQIDVEIFGNLAKTTSTLVFKNNSNRNLEGKLTFPLPENTTISGYAIDINGKLRNAVSVPKERATEVLESIQKQNIDPGLIEKVEGNNFRTRISPILANGTRTVQISYFQELNLEKDSYYYFLPLNSPNKIKNFDLTVNVYQASEKPRLIETPNRTFKFSGNSAVYTASLNKTDFALSKSLLIELPKAEDKVEAFIQKNTDGSIYFYANTILNNKTEPKIWSNNLGIIWDNSLSGLNRDHKKEIEFLGKIIQQQKNLTISVVLLNIKLEKGKTFQIKNGDWADLKTYLETTIYDGATNYEAINLSKLAAQEYLMFSDGISTLGSNKLKSNKPIYTIASTPTSNFIVLKSIAQNNLGKFINLSELSAEKAFQKISESNLQFIGIKQNNVTEIYPPIGTEIGKDFGVAGICPSTLDKITLEFGKNGKVLFTKEIDLKSASKVFEISKVWAQNKVNYLEQNADENKDDILEIGKQFSIVTSLTSLLVLENVSDYVKYKILPPNELRTDYDRLIKEENEPDYEKVNLVAEAIQATKYLKTWWNTDFSGKKTKYPKPVHDYVVPPMPVEVPVSVLYGEGEFTKPNEIPSNNIIEAALYDQDITDENDNLKKVVIIGYAVRIVDTPVIPELSNPNKKYVPEIKTFDIKSDKDYVKVLKSSKNQYETYLELRKTYKDTPSFYFDVATFFFINNQQEIGTKIVSSIAELGLEDAELDKLLAYKFKQLGQFDAELFLTQKVLKSRPFNPQSHRDYALALQDNERYQEALDYLYETITTEYDKEFANRGEQIVEALITEINNLISLHGDKIDYSKINKEMIVDIPVDVRVIINWNKDDTDIDLWIIDPNGEECYYGNRETLIGGRYSDDITDGFGPEQFMLKKAVKGKYKIMTNFFSERQMSVSGPTTISAEIYLKYSSGQQVRKMITFQNDKPDRGSDKILIGEFEF